MGEAFPADFATERFLSRVDPHVAWQTRLTHSFATNVTEAPPSLRRTVLGLLGPLLGGFWVRTRSLGPGVHLLFILSGAQLLLLLLFNL